ncbi:hypothetical protein ABTF19_19385, partial [Acinetobacter baumannii]
NSKKDVKLQLPKIKTEPGNEHFLHIYALTRTASRFLPAGFEAAKGEFALSGNNYFAEVSSKENKEWEKKEDGEKVLIQAKG